MLPALVAAAQTVASAPGQVTLISPTASVSTRRPALVWHAQQGAVYYLVRVTERTTTTDNWVTPAAAGCSLGGGTCTTTLGHDLDVGHVTWQVLAWNAFGYGQWSDTPEFIVDFVDSAAPQATAQAPTGLLDSESAPFQWARVSTAVWYRLWRRDGANIELERWLRPADAGCATTDPCHVTITPYLSDGAGTWKIQVWTTAGSGPWSATESFVASLSAPRTPQPATPNSTITDQTPTFTWPATPHAWYYLVREYVGDDYDDLWYTPDQASCAPGSTSACSVRPTQTLSAGLVSWQMLAWNESGYSEWSVVVTFRVATAAPEQVTLLTPTQGGTTHNVPAFVWQASSNATYYDVQIADNDNTTYDRWFTPAQAGCPIGEGTCGAAPVTLRGGAATWKVIPYNPIAYGPWSATWSFVACAMHVTPSTVDVIAAGQSGSISAAVDSACAWTATSSASWLHVTNGSAGTGPASIAYTADANTGVARTATLTVDDAVLNVSQASGCAYSVSPSGLGFSSSGGSAFFTVIAPAGCNWSIGNSSAWITIVSGGTGTGSGTVQYAVDQNSSNAERVATLTVTGGTTYLIAQNAPPPAISNLSPDSGTPGTSVIITGSGFGSVQGNSIVRFNGLVSTPTSWSETSITVPAPAFVTTGNVTVAVAGQVSNGVPFTYTGSGPTVTMTYVPQANAAGWYRGPVQVFFTCTDAGAGVQTCPMPVTISSEGAAQTVTVTATDLNGHYTAVTATANLDFTPPAVTITSPEPGAAVETATTTLNASLADTLSGLQSASCNGVAATVTGGTISCAVSLGPGINPLDVRALDLAGNERSASVVVSRIGTATAISVTPSRFTLTVGETRALSAVDNFGQVVAAPTWSTSDLFVATVDADGLIMAVGPGDAEITATTGSLAAPVSITVLGGPLSAGTAHWVVDSTPGWYQDQPVAVDSFSAAFVTTEVKYNSSYQVVATQVRTFDEDGRQVALVAAPLAAGEHASVLMGDAAGGLLMMVDGFNTRSIVRVPVSADDSTSWRIGGLSGYSNDTAQGPDGTIFTLVGNRVNGGFYNDDFANQAIVGIDGQTGVQRFAIHPVVPARCDDPFFNYPDYAVTSFTNGVISVDTEGYANALGIIGDGSHPGMSPTVICPGDGTAARIVLYRIAPDGTTSVTDLYRHASAGGFTFHGTSFLLPDDQGGVLATWEACDRSYIPADCRMFARHVQADNTLGQPYELPYSYSSATMISGSDRTAYYGGYYVNPRKFDMVTGSVQWTNTSPGFPAAVRADGRVEIVDNSGRTIVDPTGTLPPSGPLNSPVIQTAGTTRITAQYGDVRSVVAESFLPDQFGFAIPAGFGGQMGGGLQGRSAAPGPYGIFLKAHNVTYADATVGRHAAIRITPRNIGLWLDRRPDIFNATLTDALGHYFATLGAGPGDGHVRQNDSTTNCSLSGSPYLTDAVNFSSDASYPPVALERLQYSQKDEDLLINRLLQLDANYQDDLHYCFFPYSAPTFYNSNSFVNGLLHAAHIGEPTKPTSPSLYLGWDKAVPSTEFGTAP